MMRYHAIPLVFFVAMVASLAVASAQPPNVVLIISDDQGWGDYGFMGHEHIRTPHLDRLARDSLVFTRGYVTSPLCRPSLASIVTGLYPHQHGLTGNDVDGMNNRAALDTPLRATFHRKPSLVRTMVERDYLAHQSGKYRTHAGRTYACQFHRYHADHSRRAQHRPAGQLARD